MNIIFEQRMACQTRGMRMKQRMSKFIPEPETMSPAAASEIEDFLDDPDPSPIHTTDETIDKEKIQLKDSLTSVLNWIRTKHGRYSSIRN